MTRLRGLAAREVQERQAGQARPRHDQLAEEVPVAIEYDGEAFAVMMLTPRELEDFARGFSLTERGLAPAALVGLDIHEELEGWRIALRTQTPLASPAPARALPGRSGCGVCGQRSLEDLLRQPPPLPAGPVIPAAALEAALAALQTAQPLNAASGALHAAAWCGPDGHLWAVREDVGRHNALDKLIGARLGQGQGFDEGFALVTSRASYEMVLKAARAGIRMLVAVSAPTALAVDLARACGLSLVGFARPGRQVVYSCPDRLGSDVTASFSTETR